ncbi:MAG: AbrB/MazE/SpoVT family DNA-binding domain-containing protein [Deltaproteobacteria bacterium]|nr:AbrB/MazE/SpoVT family DNA-binding domain-containing protein [Deltaproteobacteria bacterium]
MRTVLSERGQVVIPKDIKELLGLKKGTVLDVTVQDKKVILKPLATSVKVKHWQELRGLLKGKYTSKQFLKEREKDRKLEQWK